MQTLRNGLRNLTYNMKKEFDRHNAGIKGEDAAVKFYTDAGYQIIARNWRWSNKGEIDIISYNEKNDILSICEVKTRSAHSILRPCEAVNIKKQNKIRMLTTVFLTKNKVFTKYKVRFDVIEVILEGDTLIELNFIENAF